MSIAQRQLVCACSHVCDGWRQRGCLLRLPPSTRQHPSYGDCLKVKREYCQNCSVLDCVTQCSQSAAHLCERFLHVRQIRFVTLDPYAMRRAGCLELYYCNMILFSALTLSLVIWPVKIVPEMTYNTLLSLCTTTTVRLSVVVYQLLLHTSHCNLTPVTVSTTLFSAFSKLSVKTVSCIETDAKIQRNMQIS